VLPLTAVWISVAHAVQYLWVTSYYAERAARSDPPLRHLGRALMAGALATTVPALVFAPGLLGGVPWDAGLAVLTFSVLNLHHFLLDGAVWKLRDGRVARVLLGAAPAAVAPVAAAAHRARSGALIWAIGAPCLALALLGIREAEVARSDADPDRASTALERLRWLGRDSAFLRVVVGERYAGRGDTAGAIAQYERSLSVQPTANAWAALSLAYEQRGEWEPARAADERALELDPAHTVALIHGADLALRRAASLAPADAASERERADALFRRALASHDGLQDPVTRLLGLAGGLDAAGRGDDARRIREMVSGARAAAQMTPRSRSAPTSSQL
jgi:tetratricopeptide (TPR) repeat protein